MAPTVDIPAEVTRVTNHHHYNDHHHDHKNHHDNEHRYYYNRITNFCDLYRSRVRFVQSFSASFHFRCCWLSNPPEQQRFSFDLKIWRMWRRRRGRIVKMGLDKEAVVEEELEVEEDVGVEKKQDWQ